MKTVNWRHKKSSRSCVRAPPKIGQYSSFPSFLFFFVLFFCTVLLVLSPFIWTHFGHLNTMFRSNNKEFSNGTPMDASRIK